MEPTPTTWHGMPLPTMPLNKLRLSPPRESTTTSHVSFNLREPDTYDGRKSPDAWIFNMDTYLQAKRASDDQYVLAFVASLLRDDALLWWRRHCQEWAVDHPARISNWAGLKTALEYNFRPVNQESRARDCLADLKQRGSARAYTREFRQLVMEIPSMVTSELQDRYIRGLKPNVRVEVEKSQALGLCQSLEQVIAMAEKMDTIMAATALDSSTPYRGPRLASGRRPFGWANLRTTRPQPVVQPPRMNQTPGPRPSRLMQEDRQRLLQENKCFYCKESGHIAINCPKKDKSRINRVQFDLTQDEDMSDVPDQVFNQKGNDLPQ
jgi:hypothetical protein